MSDVLLLNGPNLNLLGSREPELYGPSTLEEVETLVKNKVESAGYTLESFQTNAEHLLIEKVQASMGISRFVVINPGALTHTSIGLRDAFLSVAVPFVEVHVSNIFSREEFRQHSYLSDIAVGCISGMGVSGYAYAAEFALSWLSEDK